MAIKILFLCTHNACRSILSEAITRQLAGDRIEAGSAGTSPAGEIHPLTLEHLQKNGYSCAGLHSKSLEDIRAFAPDVVITVCDSAAGESCPVWLGDAVRVHWGLPDPSHLEGSEQEVADAFKRVIATIEARTQRLLKQPLERMCSDRLRAVLIAIAEES